MTSIEAKSEAKKTAKPKAKKASGNRVSDDTKIVALKTAKDIKSAEGTFCHAQIVACLQSKTVGEARKKLAAMKENPTKQRGLEAAWVAKSGYIRLSV